MEQFLEFLNPLGLGNALGMKVHFIIIMCILFIKYLLTTVFNYSEKKKNFLIPLGHDELVKQLNARWYLNWLIPTLLILPQVVTGLIYLLLYYTFRADLTFLIIVTIITNCVVVLSYILQGTHSDKSQSELKSRKYSIFGIEYTIFKVVMYIILYTPATMQKRLLEEKVLKHQKVLLNG